MRRPTSARYLNLAGFTLVQLLVVVTIIGLLSTIATVASRRAVTSTRETKRVHELREIQEALELYWLDNRKYPQFYTDGKLDNGLNWRRSCKDSTTYDLDYIPGLAPKYMAELPQDPLPCANHDGYYYKSNGTDYKLFKKNESSTQKPSELILKFLDPAWDGGTTGPGYCVIDGNLTEYMSVYSPGAACWR